MIQGKFYQVPCVKVTEWHRFKGWLPILGPFHEDAEFVKFPWMHYHLDWRFVPQRVFDDMSAYRGPAYVHASVIQCPNRMGDITISAGPELKRMKYKRPTPAYPSSAATWLPQLTDKYVDAKIVRGLCPHRGIPVEAMVRDGDILTCPGHGLRFSASTGRICRQANPSINSGD